MKIQSKSFVLVASVAALTLSTSTSVGQIFSRDDALNNQAVAASPRAKEQFPWLARAGAVMPAKTGSTGVAIHVAYATSPRGREQFPELARSTRPARTVIGPAIRNRAVAASPRAKEQFPWLARDHFTVSEEPFQLAPLK